MSFFKKIFLFFCYNLCHCLMSGIFWFVVQAKQSVFTLTDVPVRLQEWSGWPKPVTDQASFHIHVSVLRILQHGGCYHLPSAAKLTFTNGNRYLGLYKGSHLQIIKRVTLNCFLKPMPQYIQF